MPPFRLVSPRTEHRWHILKPFLMGQSILVLEHIQEIVTKVGPLTAHQEQQYFTNLKHTRENSNLHVVLPSTNLGVKNQISDPLQAELVEVSLLVRPSKASGLFKTTSVQQTWDSVKILGQAGAQHQSQRAVDHFNNPI
ncbi:unnamed protein product [Merluccius merluccius]